MTIYDTRRQNLRALIREWHGPTSLSRKLGHSSGSYIAQLAGPRPSRDVSEKVAREIEGKLGLPIGWMDREHADAGVALDERALSDAVRIVTACLRDAGLRPDAEHTAMLVTLAYDQSRLTGALDEVWVRRLVNLMERT